MKISPINKTFNTNKTNNINFKKGLTDTFTKKFYRTSNDEMLQRVIENGIKSVDYKNFRSVIASCLATSEIMKCFGLKLPKNFSFTPLDDDIAGSHTYPDNTVLINSNFNEFKSILAQDDYETYRKTSPITKHFLQTYLHEFIHAAHYNHLSELHPFSDILTISKTLKKNEPTNKLTEPKVIKPTWPKWEVKWNNSILGDYANTNLIEFFTENAVFEIAKILETEHFDKNSGENIFFNQEKGKKISLPFLNSVKNSSLDRFLNKNTLDRQILLNAIWDGDLNTIFDKKYSKYIRQKDAT